MADTTYKLLRDRIFDKVNALNRFEVVKKFPDLNFGGYPAATVIPSDGDVDYETSSDDQRTYAFIINIYFPITPGQEEKALDAVMQAADDVLDTFTTDKQLSSPSPITFPTGKIIIGVRPVFTSWGATDDKKLMIAEITVSIAISTST